MHRRRRLIAPRTEPSPISLPPSRQRRRSYPVREDSGHERSCGNFNLGSWCLIRW
uniref:Uncharacterized protein n=1 Tax=Arundo donax TaxID=35708 RepID=A0A0A9FSG3_ARUDO